MTEAEKFCEENNGLNGLMNKISMGLKDAALQQGFEVICKRLAKLEKELMHLKGCKTCTDRPKGELATVCATEYEGHCIAQKMTYIKELQEEIEGLKKNALVWHDYETEKPQKEGECILIIEREFCGQKRQMKCLHYAEETNMGFNFITNHKILKWGELPEV